MSVLHFQSLRTAGSWAYDALWLWKCKSRAFKDNCWVSKTRYDLFQRGSRVFLHCFWGFPLVQFSCSDMSDSLQHHEPQHARPLCPSPTPRVHPNPCPLSQWCYQGSPKRNKSFCVYFYLFLGFSYSSVGKESACNAGDPGLIPVSGRSPEKG